MKILATLIKITLISCLLIACQGKDRAKDHIKVGVITGPETQLMVVAKQVAKEKFNLKVDIVEFISYIHLLSPNLRRIHLVPRSNQQERIIKSRLVNIAYSCICTDIFMNAFSEISSKN